MNNNKQIMIAAALIFLLTACKQNSAQESTPDPQAVVTVSPNAVSSITPSPVPSSVPSSIPLTEPSPTITTTPTEKAISIAKTYHMNKVYDIVPNDPEGNKKVVLLTFDDGPKDQKMIESLITTLEKHQAKAIFFMNGYRIKQHPELLTYIHEQGQVLGNHSWDHISLKSESADKVAQQMDDVQTIVKEITGEEPQFFRPPFGSGGDVVKDAAKQRGMLFMTWSNGSLDWEMSTKKNDPNKVIDNVMKQLHPGSNILMHELQWTVDALDKLLTELEEKGYSFVDPQSIELEMR